MSSRDDWYRNRVWNEEIASAFRSKLNRARRREQYLRIQASYLAKTFPTAALDLLNEYFGLPNQFDHAAGHVTRAEALLALNRESEAIQSYEAALRREADFPQLKTRAFLELPYLIALRKIASHYDRALEILNERKADLFFPVDHFMWHTSRALIVSAKGHLGEARKHARAAFEAAAKDQSGFRFHPTIGLVSDRHADALSRLRQFHDA